MIGTGQYETWAVQRTPYWLGDWGRRWSRVIGRVADATALGVKLAVVARFPRYAPDDALEDAGADRATPAVPGESSIAHRRRVAEAWEIKPWLGTATGIVLALGAYGFDDETTYALDQSTPFIWDGSDWWSRFWIIAAGDLPFTDDGVWGGPGAYGDGGTWGTNATVEQIHGIRVLVQQSKAHHGYPVQLMLVFSGEVWGMVGTWGTDDGVWGNADVVRWPLWRTWNEEAKDYGSGPTGTVGVWGDSGDWGPWGP